MPDKTFPISPERVEELARQWPTPFHLYDETAIRTNLRRLRKAFSLCEGFREYYAVKACPNPFIMKILADEGCGADASSLPEIMLAEEAGMRGEMIMFTSNDTPASEFVAAARSGAVINFDDLSHIDFCARALKESGWSRPAAGGSGDAGVSFLPELACCRYNPGPLKDGNSIIGKPEEAKYGFTREQLFAGYAKLRDLGATRFGLHTMVASNELNPDYFVETCRILFELAVELHAKTGIRLEFVNMGGGIGIPYKPDQKAVDLEYVAKGIRAEYDRVIVPSGLAPLRLYMEAGRVITGPYGWLVTRVIHRKSTYRDYVGVDASMADLMRPGMYGAYHHVSVVAGEAAGKPGAKTEVVDVAGSLCENNDKFAVQRELPVTKPGDLLAIHDTGAHGRAMCFNYNGKLRSGELLLRGDGTVIEIRRRETVADYFATLDFAALRSFDARAKGI